MIRIIMALLVGVTLFCYSERVFAKERNHSVTASLAETTVNVEEGTLLGYLDYGIYTFLGVPYATAKRFEPPQKVAPWAGVRDATRPGEIFPQTPTNRIAVDEFFNPHRQLSANEHCQFLNIWTPSIARDKKRPVMLWLHGGAFTDGSSIEPLYHGRNLSEKGDLVFVSLNHRLGAGGFLDLSTFGAPYRNSANSGLADLVAALEWIKTNIETFGGDPDNVTILGQSGGGAKVLTLMATPAAKGLFHKAIVQSGAAPNLGMTLTDQEISRKVGQLTAEILGLADKDIHKIQELPYDVVAKAANEARKQLFDATGIRHVWGPVLNDYIPVHPVGSEFAEQSKDIPLLIGSVLNEFTTIVRHEAVELMMDNKKTWDEAKVVSKLK
jgi:para-nitrobenzyl esterase